MHFFMETYATRRRVRCSVSGDAFSRNLEAGSLYLFGRNAMAGVDPTPIKGTSGDARQTLLYNKIVKLSAGASAHQSIGAATVSINL